MEKLLTKSRFGIAYKIGVLVRLITRNFSQRKGLEIGGPSQLFSKEGAFPIYPLVGSLNTCNFSGNTIWEGILKPGRNFKYQKGKRPGYQYLCEAVDLTPIESKRYDFVLCSHTLEHIANPLKAIAEWLRVLKDRGILLLVLPFKEGTFDHRRPVTSFKHLVEDFEKDRGEEDLTHLPEILKLHDLSLDPPAGSLKQFKKRSVNNFENRCLHHHVFDEPLIRKIFRHFKLKAIFIDRLLPFHLVAIARKAKRSTI